MDINTGSKIAYGAASAGDVIVANLVIVYGLYYLTDVVGMDALRASNVIFTANMICTVSVIVTGYFTDHRPVAGRRRTPYMMGSLIPMTLALAVFFGVCLPPSAYRGTYYIIVLSVLLISHGFYMVPYEALGADVTKDQNLRTQLRSYARWFMGAGNLIGVVIILPLIEKLCDNGLSETASWRVTVSFASVMALTTFFYTAIRFIRFRDVAPERYASGDSAFGRNPGSSVQDMLQGHGASRQWRIMLGDYAGMLKNRPLRIIIYITLLMSTVNIFFNACIVYYMKYNIGISENAKAIVLLFMSVAGLVMVPVISRLCARIDKSLVMGGLYMASGVMFILCGLIGISTMVGLAVLTIAYSLGSSAYWQLIYVLIYEVCDRDEKATGVKREGTAISAFRVAIKITNAGAAQAAGIVLALFGYESYAPVQTEMAMMGIASCVMFIPGILSLVAAFMTAWYRRETISISCCTSSRQQSVREHQY